MSRVKTLALTMAVLFALAGCAQLFEFNLFGALDTPPVPTAADYEGADGLVDLDKLDEDLDSPAVVDAMTDEVVAEIEQNIWDDYLDDGVSGEEDQLAAILYADLALKTSGGEELVNNIAEVILEDLIDGTSTVADILADIIPPEALEDPTGLTFAAMVNALLTANDAYLLLGASIDQIAPFGEADPGATLPPSALPGDVAQKAIVACTMRATVDAIMTAPPPPDVSEADAIAAMFLIATDDPGADAGLAGLTPDTTPPNPILALLDLAGLSLP
ncbi:MAG: hypothetical protein NTU62_01145 [Spirochaetes bacterium]|jgi:hypothetical protein|nr:hypothetical protein [Spirochaetota bacterium]